MDTASFTNACRKQILIDELPSLEDSREELERKIAAGDPRESNPVLIVSDAKDAETQKLVHIKTGEKPDVDTTFTVHWEEDALVFDITCHEPDMENLFSTQSVWDGDSVAILLETPNHSYYQIEISPDGVIFDADRLYGKVNSRWTAMAEILETEHGKDFWRMKIKIPVLPPEKNMGDPYHYVVGSKPSKENPWFFNVGRNRVRGEDISSYMFNPVGPEGKGYHEVDAFATLIVDVLPEEK